MNRRQIIKAIGLGSIVPIITDELPAAELENIFNTAGLDDFKPDKPIF